MQIYIYENLRKCEIINILYRSYGSAIESHIRHGSLVKRRIAVPVHSEYRGVSPKPVTDETNSQIL